MGCRSVRALCELLLCVNDLARLSQMLELFWVDQLLLIVVVVAAAADGCEVAAAADGWCLLAGFVRCPTTRLT